MTASVAEHRREPGCCRVVGEEAVTIEKSKRNSEFSLPRNKNERTAYLALLFEGRIPRENAPAVRMNLER